MWEDLRIWLSGFPPSGGLWNPNLIVSGYVPLHLLYCRICPIFLQCPSHVGFFQYAYCFNAGDDVLSFPTTLGLFYCFGLLSFDDAMLPLH